jgi:hypothetical protein
VWGTVLHTWDIFMLMGRKGLLRVGLAILKACQSTPVAIHLAHSLQGDLLQLNGIDQLVPYLFNIPAHRLDTAVLFQVCLSLTVLTSSRSLILSILTLF